MEENQRHSPIEKIRTTSVAEVFKKQLDELRESKKLTIKEKKKIDEIVTLINFIGQMKIEEPQMLLRIWEAYNP